MSASIYAFGLPPAVDSGSFPRVRVTHLRYVLAGKFGKPMDFLNHSDLDLMARNHLNADLQTLIDTNVNSATNYRTYINSLYVKNSEGKSAWLLPRYKARKGEDPKAIESIENRVEPLYLSVHPEADVHWVDSDAMPDSLGVIHCTTLVIPRTAIRNDPVKNLKSKNGSGI